MLLLLLCFILMSFKCEVLFTTLLFDHPLAKGQEKPEFAKQIQGFFWQSSHEGKR